MEKRKLLLVAVSVGVFLVIVISASILIFTPKPSSGEARPAIATANPGTVISTPKPIPAGTGAGEAEGGGTLQPEPAPARTQPASADVVDMVRKDNGIPGLQSPPAASTVQENNFRINGENTSINVPIPSTAAVPASRQAEPASRSAPSTVPARAAPAAPTSPAAKPAAATPAAAPAAKPAATPAAKPAAVSTAKPASSRTNNDYWIQIGAFSAKVRAEGVKETLASKGITTIIDNRDVDGKTLYRVRVGPYTSETEAGYWLALVKEINGFSDSQIRSSVRR
ncbi:hypothetical protein AGMMS49546_09400 [Spirochaetia bacterium]|nr:hypothetical protein AGMMS49546_09400 [Spirochaetia bacterium]